MSLRVLNTAVIWSIKRVEPSDELFDSPRLVVRSLGEILLHSLSTSRVASAVEEWIVVVATALRLGVGAMR